MFEGGLARHVRKLSEHLVAEGVEVHVLTRGGGRLPPREDRHGVIVHRLSEPPFPKDPKAFVRWVADMNSACSGLARIWSTSSPSISCTPTTGWLRAPLRNSPAAAGCPGWSPFTPPSTDA